ncbi:acyl-CoA dehydrogenase family protein [Haloactinomyces albus]|uniref:Dibenzothiophene monooxygenase n=1 Tax=Haloactinomyces albus TaxID=1352928 RepID=A0AAE4CLN0_9ACTN|nr:acyl-CoA dehydrogenase family protein [Haloactinomyces albus]MDR7300102.1 alkylation response protein AidB-like acyl-CoA dehydrogenase [Haloactinomyces albus]
MPTDPAAAHTLACLLRPRLAARASEHDLSGSFPTEDFEELRAHGLLGLMAPARLGGCGASFADYAAVAAELASGAGSTALIFNMHASVTGALAHLPEELVRELGAPEDFAAVRDRVLSGAAEGALYAVAMSERGAGSRLSRLATRYRRVGEGFHITGSKAFVSGAGHADAYLVAARDAEAGETADSREAAVSYFLVPGERGVRVEPTWDSMGMRATGSHDLHLDAEVGPEALLGGVEGLSVLMAEVMPQWLVASYAAVYAGVARAAVQEGAAHLRARDLHTLPAVRARMGRADAAVAGAELVVTEAARRVAEAPGTPETNRWVWRAKMVAGDTAAEVASSMLEAAGTSATRRGHPLERIYRDARCGALQPATSDVCADWLGVAALDGDPDRDAQVPRW